MTVKWSAARLEELRLMLVSGVSIEDAGKHFSVSKQRISALKFKNFPELNARRSFGRSREVAERVTDSSPRHRRSSLEKAQRMALNRKRANFRSDKRLKLKDTPFEIEYEDLKWPTHCPMLGIELDWMGQGRAENSPSFDRIDASKGYVKGNVHVISWRANRIKNDGTAEEHLRIGEYMKRLDNRVGIVYNTTITLEETNA